MTEAQRRMLALLGTKRSPFPPGILGCELWRPESPTAKPQSYARPAGNLLNALRRLGFARWTKCWGSRQWGWEITAAGVAALEAAIK